MAFIGGGQEPRIEATKSEKRSGRGEVLTEHAFYTLFSLCMHTSSRHSAQTLLARSLWLSHTSQGKEFPCSSAHASSRCRLCVPASYVEYMAMVKGDIRRMRCGT